MCAAAAAWGLEQRRPRLRRVRRLCVCVCVVDADEHWVAQATACERADGAHAYHAAQNHVH
eukprot:399161-Prorocentrum_minimum.AAC.1